MPAYIIVDIEVVDAEGFADYRAKVPAVAPSAVHSS